MLVLLVLVRLPVYVTGLPLLVPELQWMLLGEQLNKGFMLYVDVWDSTAPLAALVYAGLDAVFGRSQAAYEVAALLCSAIQVVYFNEIMHRRGVFPERNFIPGLLYLVVLSGSVDCFTLSPALLASLFLLLALGTLLKQLNRAGATDEVFEIGFYISTAGLFYPPAGLFIIWAVVSLVLYSGASFRQHFLNLFGFLFPFLLTALFYYLDGNYEAFSRIFLASVFQIRQYNLNDFQSLLLAVVLPLTVAVLGFFRILNYGRYTNFQTRAQQIMVFWAVTSVLSVALMPFLAPMQFIVFAPCVTFFCVHFFTSFRRQWVPELIFLFFFGGVLLICYQTVYPIFGNTVTGQLAALRLQPPNLPPDIRGKRIIVLGDALSEYRDNFPATPYLNWKLARYDLEHLDNYDNVINILRNFEQDPPEYIIDRQALVPKLFQRIPALQRRYRKVGEGIYRRV
ncbi:MAG: DUF6427 family protein [Cytophagaceae bacterium]|nr:DUF6427 family protein [Cytophagaceae bacterium]